MSTGPLETRGEQSPDRDQAGERPGAVVDGRYKLLEQIGEGGMGTVWVADQTAPVRRKVAMKLIKAGMDSSTVLSRFEAERQALAMMDHPNIAKVLDGGVTESGRPFFVMEYVKGIPLTKYCDDAHLSVAERLALFVPVCQAVQHAHQKGIIHRDLKPSNILVCLYDGVAVPKVIDFGLVKAMHQPLTEHSLYTAHGVMIGTPLYMSPEQAEFNNLDVDTRTDVYSLGVILYELLTGTTPLEKQRFKEAAWHEVLRLIKDEEPPRPSTRLSSSTALASLAAQRRLEPAKLTKLIRGELDWIVMKALEKDRSRRYETATGLARDVERYLADEAVEACPPSATYRLRKFARKHRAGLAMAATSVLLLLAGAGVSAWQAVRASRAETDAIADRDETERARAAEAQEKTRAGVNEQKALDALAAAQRHLYHASVSLAHGEWYANRADRAEQILDACPSERRGWEWGYLKRICRSDLLTIRDPDLGVTCVAFSADGRRLATGGEGGLLKVWDSASGAQLLSLHTENVNGIAFSGDGRLLAAACGSYDEVGKSTPGEVRVWDAASGAELFTLRGHSQLILCVAFSPDTALLATGGVDAVKIWDARTGKELLTIGASVGSFQSVAFSPDGKKLAGASRDSLVRLWDPRTGKDLSTFRGHEGIVWSISFSPDGRRLASASHDHTVKVWEALSGKELLTCHGHTNEVNSVAFSPDGKLIASGGRDGILKVWEANTGRVLLDVRGHSNPIVGVAFSPDGRVASASEDRTVKVWDPRMGQEATSLQHGGARGNAFSPDGQSVASVAWGQPDVRIWDAASGVAVFRLRGHNKSRNGTETVAFSPDGSRLATAGDENDPTVKLWDASTGAELFSLEGHKEGVSRLAFAAEGPILASVSRDGTLRLWDLLAREELRRIAGSSLAVAFSPNGRYVASDGQNNRVLVRNATTGAEFLSLSGHTGPVRSVAFSQDGKLLASAGVDQTVKVWDAHLGTLLISLAGHAASVNALAFSPDSSRLVSAGDDMTLRVWETATWQAVITLRGHTDRVDGLSFSRDGHRIASASFDGTVRIWDASPLTIDSAEQREGGRVVRYHLEGVASREELLEAIRLDRSLSESVRRRSLTLAAHVAEDPQRLNSASWSVVAKAGESQAAYLLALRQASAACNMEPDDGNFRGTLGTARYRTGDWKGAILDLEKTVSLRETGDHRNANEGFFLAMAHWQLGAKAEARIWFKKSVQWMDKEGRNDVELRRFHAEAAELLEMGKKH